MTDPPEPLEALRDDVENVVRRRWRDVRWWVRKFAGAQLTALVLGGAASVALLVAAVPLFAAAAAAVVVIAAVGYAVYARKQLIDERSMRRWAFVDVKRLQQQVLERELALDIATLILVNDPKDRETARRMRGLRSAEFAAAVRYLRARVQEATVPQRPQPAKAAVHGHTTPRAPTAQEMLRDGGRVPSAPVAPDVAGVRRRRDLRTSEIAKLEAELQALEAPDVIELAFAAEEAATSYKDQRAAAHAADRAARDRQRAGRKPTAPGPDAGFVVSFHPNGNRDVRQTQKLTPEQIARGEQPADGTP